MIKTFPKKHNLCIMLFAIFMTAGLIRENNLFNENIQMFSVFSFHEQHGLEFEIPKRNVNHRVFFVNSSEQINHFDVLVVGAGLSGSVIAERYAAAGLSVLLVEKRTHLAGNCYDYVDNRTGIRMNEYGAHLFHTNEPKIWNYVNAFSKWSRFDHRVLAWVDGKYVPVPVNINTVNLLFDDTHIQNSFEMESWLKNEINTTTKPKNSEDMAISRVGKRLFQKIFEPYTQKQWNMSAKDLDPSVTGRIPVFKNFDNRYFSDKYQGLPDHGYTSLVESMLKHPFIQVWLNKDFFELDQWIQKYPKKIYYTGPIDLYVQKTFSDLKDQTLEYRSLRFEKAVVLNHQGLVLPAPVVNYPSLDYPYTRVVEYKQLPMQTSSHSILVREYPSATGEPYYPIPNAKNKLAYFKLRSRLENTSTKTVFVGRLANYKYFNMDDAIKNSLEVYWNETRRLHIVITKFKEDISWIQKLCSMLKNVRTAWFVYLKNQDEKLAQVQSDVEYMVSGCNYDSVTVIDHRANVGREGLAWAEYMLSYGSDSTNDLTKLGIIHVFLQGNIEAPLFKVANYVNKNIFKKELDIDMEPFDHIG